MAPSLSLRPLAVLAATSAVAIAAAGCGSSSPAAAGGGGDPAASVPATAPVYLEAVLRPEGDQQDNAEAILGKLLGTADVPATIREQLDAQTRKGGSGVVFSRDIEPWLGDRAAVAVTAISGSKASDAQALVVVDTTDPDKAEAALAKTADGAKRTYQGVGYTVRKDTARAVLDDVILFGDEPSVKAAIDASEGKAEALADVDAFEKMRETVDQTGIGSIYLDLGGLVSAITQTSSGSAASGLSALKGLAGGTLSSQLGAVLSAAPEALHIEGAITGANAAGRPGGTAGVAGVPAGALVAIGLGDLGTTLQTSLGQLAKSGGIGGVDPSTLLSQLGVDLDRDFTSWMGDAALWVSGTSLAEPHVALVITSKDAAASQAAVGKLRTLLRQAGVSTRATAVPGGTGLQISLGANAPTIEVAAKGDRFVIAYGEGTVEQALAPGARLDGTAGYRNLVTEMDGQKPQVYVAPSLLAGAGVGSGAARTALPHLGPIGLGGHVDGDVTRLKGAILIR